MDMISVSIVSYSEPVTSVDAASSSRPLLPEEGTEPDTDSGDVVGTDSSDGLLSSLAVGGGWDMPEAGAGGKDVEDSGAAVGEASGGTEVPGLVLALVTMTTTKFFSSMR